MKIEREWELKKKEKVWGEKVDQTKCTHKWCWQRRKEGRKDATGCLLLQFIHPYIFLPLKCLSLSLSSILFSFTLKKALNFFVLRMSEHNSCFWCWFQSLLLLFLQIRFKILHLKNYDLKEAKMNVFLLVNGFKFSFFFLSGRESIKEDIVLYESEGEKKRKKLKERERGKWESVDQIMQKIFGQEWPNDWVHPSFFFTFLSLFSLFLSRSCWWEPLFSSWNPFFPAFFSCFLNEQKEIR